MRRVSLAILLALAVCGTNAFSSESPAPETPVGQPDQIKMLLNKIENLEKRIAALEEQNGTLGQHLDQLTSLTEIGVPFDVERAMMGEGMFRSNQSGQFQFQDRYEYRVEPGTIVVPPKE